MKRSEVKSVVLYIVDHYNTEAMEVSDDKRMNELIDECCGVVARQNAKERRKTVRAKRPVQQRKVSMCRFCRKKINVVNGSFQFHLLAGADCPGSGTHATVA